MAFDQLAVMAERTDLLDLLDFLRAAIDLHHGVEVFFQKARGIADFPVSNPAVTHPAVECRFTHIEVIGSVFDRVPLRFAYGFVVLSHTHSYSVIFFILQLNLVISSYLIAYDRKR